MAGTVTPGLFGSKHFLRRYLTPSESHPKHSEGTWIRRQWDNSQSYIYIYLLLNTIYGETFIARIYMINPTSTPFKSLWNHQLNPIFSDQIPPNSEVGCEPPGPLRPLRSSATSPGPRRAQCAGGLRVQPGASLGLRGQAAPGDPDLRDFPPEELGLWPMKLGVWALQGGAPKTAKLVYDSNNYGLLYL